VPKRAFAITSIAILILLLLIVFQVYLQTTESAIAPIAITTSSPENVTIYFLDVGQGDSILVKTASKNILIDGGPTDAGNTMVNDLNTYQVSKIDLMVATHPHADHIGGLISVLQSNILVQDIIYNGLNYTSTQTFNTWKTFTLSHNLTQGFRGQIYAMSPTINFTVLSPTSPTQFTDMNAESIVMKLQVGNVSVMLTGDAQYDTEQFLVSSGSNLQSQILKVGHHGSSTSTSQSFLNAVAPNYAAISCGLNNQYGHPTQQTIDILSSNNIITYGTYAYGTIIFSLNAATADQTPPSSPPGSSPSPPPTIKPTSEPTSNPTSSSPSPTMPELPSLIVFLIIIAASTFSIWILKRKHVTLGTASYDRKAR